MRRRGAGGTPRVLLVAGLAGTVLLAGCDAEGTPAASPPSSGPGTTAAPPAPTTATPTTATPTTATPTPGPTRPPRVSLGFFEVTCHSGPGVTASGRPSSREVVSVDRRLFPFGTRLVIDQVGVRVAADTGPALVGRRLDIWEPSTAACVEFGRKRLQVWRAP